MRLPADCHVTQGQRLHGLARVASARGRASERGQFVDKLRWPFLVAAIVVTIVIVTIELGTVAPIFKRLLNIEDAPPGIAIAAMALLDFQLVFATVLYGLGVVLPHPAIGRIQG